MPEVVPNVGADPINPAYYAGTACAEIIERMPTNVAFAAKYSWRLGEKDVASQEAGKSIWYLQRQMRLAHQITQNPWFRSFAKERVEAAFNAGKLDANRALIMTHLIEYTVTGNQIWLHRAIELFETYL